MKLTAQACAGGAGGARAGGLGQDRPIADGLDGTRLQETTTGVVHLQHSPLQVSPTTYDYIFLKDLIILRF